jgi:hypothetical protein
VGPATLTIVEADGRHTSRVGAFHYIEPLVVEQISPVKGSIVGGTTVTVTGRGFPADEAAIRIFVGVSEVLLDDITVIDQTELEFVTPPGQLGPADVRIVLANGQEELLEGGFTYLQPVKSFIDSPGRFYDIKLDPTGTYAVAAKGTGGVVIYNIDSSTYIADVDEVTNLDELLEKIDRNGDYRDDRIINEIKLPGGYAALGVELFFERGSDRIFVTAARLGSPPSDGRLFIIAVDSFDITQATIIDELPLHVSFAKGLEVENNQAVVAMAEGGIGFVDAYLHSKIYLSDNLVLPGGKPALDVARISRPPGENDSYVVVAGNFNFYDNRLDDEERVGEGGFYIVERHPQEGLRIRATLDIPAGTVIVEPGSVIQPASRYAYLAAGDAGLIIVDISDLDNPTVIYRLQRPAYDISIRGHIIHLAQGELGIASFDITDPANPIEVATSEAYNGNAIDIAFATPYSVIGAGSAGVQETPDAILKLHLVDPVDGILDRDTDGAVKVRLRFNKAIDLYDQNRSRFSVLGPDGQPLPITVEITNNDALLYLTTAELLTTGDLLTVVAAQGLVATKPVFENGRQINLELYRLLRDQQVELVYRGDRPDTIAIDSVVPRRIAANQPATVTVSMLGIPGDPARVRMFVGELAATIERIEQHNEDERMGIAIITVPAIAAGGQYDLTVQVEKDGIWQTDVLHGALQVDLPIEFTSITPPWGPLRGGTTATITGRGFEPGNTVMDGLSIQVGSLPARSIRVYSSTLLEITTPRGFSGLATVRGRDRYGNETWLEGEEGFGYGLAQIAHIHADHIHPYDVLVDQQSGVAAVAAGYVQSYFAATYDINHPTKPLLVGGVPTLPSDEAGRREIARYEKWKELSSLLTRTDEQQTDLERLAGTTLPQLVDSIRIEASEDVEYGIAQQRLFVAAGNAGVGRLNFNEQNGLQIIESIGVPCTAPDYSLVRDLEKAGASLFATRAGYCGCIRPPPPPCGPCLCAAPPTDVTQLNYAEPSDPLDVGTIETLPGGELLVYRDGWLFNGSGSERGFLTSICRPAPETALPQAGDGASGRLTAANIFDPYLTRTYSFTGPVHDLDLYGDYLTVALGDAGLDIFHQDYPEQRIRFNLDELQEAPASARRLYRAGNLLLVAADGAGVIVLDTSQPLAPRVISAGNDETINSFDLFRDRLIAGAGPDGLRTMQLPAALIHETSVDEGGFIAAGEDFIITFNEPVAVASLVEAGAVQITRADTGDAIAVTVTPIDQTDSSARSFALSFAREGGASYHITMDGARTLRGTGQWAPFIQTLRQAHEDARRPLISGLEGNIFHRRGHGPITIHGDRFRDSDELRGYVDQYPVALTWIDEQTMEIPAGALDLLPLEPGQHHLRVIDHELIAAYPGALVMGDELAGAQFSITPDSVDEKGGYSATISADKAVILPGAKVMLRGTVTGREIRSETNELGFEDIDLLDDVKNLTTFTFRIPGVFEPELYEVYLRIGATEVLVGTISYTLSHGMGIELPNYPPHQIGAAEAVGDTLFVGVKAGSTATSNNRFLIPAGLEIYDISIWEHPVRISQLAMEEPVYGLTVADTIVYLANGENGLAVVSIIDPGQPLLVRTYPIPGHRAMDVAINHQDKILAMAAADDLGTGFIRFFDLTRDRLDPPVGYSTIVFSDGELRGQPIVVQWLHDQLYVLLKRGTQLHLVIFDDLPDLTSYHVQEIERGFANNLGTPAMRVQHGQVTITDDNELLVLQPDETGYFATIYWNDIDSTGGELFANVGGTFISKPGGVVDTASPSLAVSDISPISGSTIALRDPIRIQFNDLINTDPGLIAEAITLTTGDGTPLPAGDYELVAANTLAGAYVDVVFTDSATYRGALTITVTTAIRALSAIALIAPVQVDYTLVDGIRPDLDGVTRLVDGAPTGPYFHGDGTETARLSGRGFGDEPGAVQIFLGETQLVPSAISLISDTAIDIAVPHLFLANEITALPVTVQRGTLTATLNGAMVVMPPLYIDDINPIKGLPQGGNQVDLYGGGFTSATTVYFDGTVAGDVRLLSGNHIRVRAPSGDFGYAAVTADNPEFPGEFARSPVDYFYAGGVTGSVELARDKPSPVAAIHLGDQLIYAVTGGSYQVIDAESGRLARVLRSQVARLAVADISDPVHPVIIEKEFGGQFLPYHIDIDGGLSPQGFAAVTGAGVDLLAAGGTRLFHFDTTLAAEPILLNTVELAGTARDVVLDGRIIYLSDSAGIHIYEITDQRRIQLHASIPTTRLRGTTNALFLDGDRLWAAMANSRRVIAIELLSGTYEIVRDIPVTIKSGARIRPGDIYVHGDHLFVSTGSLGSVELFVTDDTAATAVASLNLAYLVRDGELNSGQLDLRGQTLYVAAGQGDLQLFDVAAWLEGRYNIVPTLRHYFSVMGDAQAFAFHPRAMYVGSAFPYRDGVAVENPIEGGAVSQLGGKLNTIKNDLLTITGHTPEAEGLLPVSEPVTIEFNRHLDYHHVQALGDQLLVVSLDGVKIAGMVSLETHAHGSRLIFEPLQPWQADRRYRVTLAGSVRDNLGVALAHPYSFRFYAKADNRPLITEVAPRFASWRGGAEITLTGENFTVDTLVSVAGVELAPETVIAVTPTRLRFRLPPLSQSPADNLVVGVGVRNGAFSDALPVAFTYIADPLIARIGAYDRIEDVFSPDITRFAFNDRDIVAIEGSGFSELTRVSINGEPAEDVILERPGLLSFRLPANTIGRLDVSVTNVAGELDLVTTDELLIELIGETRLTNVTRMYRYEDLLLLLDAGHTWKLMTTAETVSPQLLATGRLPGPIIDAALSDEAMVFAYENGSRHQVRIFDTTNIYAPEVINELTNEPEYRFGHAFLIGDMVVLTSADHRELYRSSLRTTHLEPFDIDAGVRDIAVDEHGVYLLFSTRVDFYAGADLDAPPVVYDHAVIDPEAIIMDGQRMAIRSAYELEVVNSFQLRHEAANALIGRVFMDHQQALLNGELLALRPAYSDLIRIYDVGAAGDEASLTYLADVRTLDSNTLKSADFYGRVLEWIERVTHGDAEWFMYRNIELPFNNLYDIAPQRIGAADMSIAAAITGAADNWQQSALQVEPMSNGAALTGFNRALGRFIHFEPVGNSYQLGETYQISLGANPATLIAGAEVDIDLPWYITTEPLFGLSPLKLTTITPTGSITNRAVTYQVTGQQLQTIESMTIGEVALTANELDIADDGATLSFAASFPTTGFKSVRALQAQSNETAALPVAILVTQAIEIDSVTTDNERGSSYVSDSGGDRITITGRGLVGALSVHLVPFQDGYVPGPANRVAHRLVNGAIVIGASPTALPATQYQIVIVRDETAEVVGAGSHQLLTGIDDTRPVIESTQDIDYLQSLKLTFNEPVTGSDFTVIKTFLDYSDQQDIDISDRFELVNITDSTVVLRLRNGFVFADNARYTITIRGLQDSAGNFARFSGNDPGVYTDSFTADDTLPPRGLSVVRLPDETTLNEAMQLTRGRGYEFLVAAVDNYSSGSEITYTYRLSTAFNAPQTGKIPVASDHQFSQDILKDYQYLEIRLEATDREGNTAVQEFRSALRDPVVELTAFSSIPAEPEEMVRVKLGFDLAGDIDMVTGARMSVSQIQKGRPLDVFDSFDAIYGYVSASFLNPRIRDLIPSGTPLAPVEMTAKLEVDYGFDYHRVFEQTYTLYLDRTLPTIAIVSPEDGDHVPIGEPVDVLIQAFDKYGIDTVEVARNDGAYTSLADITRYRFTPEIEDQASGVIITARAIDSNNNVSEPAQITLYPYDGEAGAPRLEIISPANGATFHEGETVSFEVRLRNVTTAELYLDIGGIEDDTAVPITITRSADGPERQFVQAVMPPLDEDIVIQARLQQGTLKAYAFLTVLNDDGIDTPLDLAIYPPAYILSGTSLLVESGVPATMTDFDASSSVRITDPASTGTVSTAPVGSPLVAGISAVGTEVEVNAAYCVINQVMNGSVPVLSPNSPTLAMMSRSAISTPPPASGSISSSRWRDSDARRNC